MASPKLKFYFREPTIDTNIPITDGTVKIEGFDWEFVPNEAAADAWDCGFAARVRAYAQAAPHISIPAFPNRKFRLAYIFVNSKAGIETAKDLQGRRVGIIQWDNTAGGVGARRAAALLRHRLKKYRLAGDARDERRRGRGHSHPETRRRRRCRYHPGQPARRRKD